MTDPADDRPSRAGRISQSDLAELLGVTRQSVHELVQRGVLRVGPDGLLGLAESRDAILANVRPDSKSVQLLGALAPPAPPPAHAQPAAMVQAEQREDYNAVRLKQAVTDLRKSEAALHEQLGELVRRAATRSAWAARVAAMRERCMQVPSRMAPVLAAEPDQALIYEHLEREMLDVLAYISEIETGMQERVAPLPGFS